MEAPVRSIARNVRLQVEALAAVVMGIAIVQLFISYIQKKLKTEKRKDSPAALSS